MKKGTIGKKAGTVISIMLVAVMLFCAACSSSSNKDVEPDDVTTVTDTEKKATVAPAPATKAPDPVTSAPEPVTAEPDPVTEAPEPEPDPQDDDDNDNDDIIDDSNDENIPDYGTYAYKPDGQIPFFEEVTLDSLFSSEAELEAKMDEIIKAHKTFCQENGREYEPLDPSSVGTTPEGLWGIYCKSGGQDEERVPYDEVETWLVMFKGGVYAIYDKGFKHVMKSGALMSDSDNNWQTFSVEEDGTANVLWEFNGNDITCNDGYFVRAFELWDYDSENGGTSDGGDTGYTGYTGDTDTSNNLEMYFAVDPITEFFSMDTSLFGVSYKEFKKLLGISDMMQPEDWPWWGNNLKVVYVGNEYDTFACFFQNDSLVTVYRDSPGEGPGRMHWGATLELGEPDREYEYWNGTTAYEWMFNDFYFRQNVETYSEGDMHYRQQYMSYEFEE